MVLFGDTINKMAGRFDQKKISVDLAEEAVSMEGRTQLGNMGLVERSVRMDGPLCGESVEGELGDENLVGSSQLANRACIGKDRCGSESTRHSRSEQL